MMKSVMKKNLMKIMKKKMTMNKIKPKKNQNKMIITIARQKRCLGVKMKISWWFVWLNCMDLKSGLLLLNTSLEELANSVVRDGIIIWIQRLINNHGEMMKNGYCFYVIASKEINGQKLHNIFQEEQIILLKITGILQWKKVFLNYFNVYHWSNEVNLLNIKWQKYTNNLKMKFFHNFYQYLMKESIIYLFNQPEEEEQQPIWLQLLLLMTLKINYLF